LVHHIQHLSFLHIMSSHTIFLPFIIFAGMAYAILAKKLTVSASFTGGVLACVIFMGSGFTGLAMMTAFFILGSVATSWQRHKKQAFVSAKENRTGRSALQVFANAGVSAIAGFVMIGYPELSNLVLPVMAAAFASATADTLSSELGMLYGRQFFNIITLTADRCGMDGVVSLEGTLIGVVGSCVIAVVYALGFGWNMNFIFIVLGGTVGNLTDSLLGALLERKGWIGNNMVNFLNTLTAGLLVLLLKAVS
jgi:uncharacterized protein (TIGR00297 family)